jgi:5'(3')-deoxyribonucleotidase
MKPTIYIDLDGMAVNLLKKLIHFYNEDHGTNVTLATAWEHLAPAHAPAAGKPVGDALDHYLERDKVFDDLDPIDGFTGALPELQDLGHVVIASAPSRNPDSATAKLRWVLDRFPIHRRDIILIKHKHLLRGEVWLEDWHDNIEKIRETNPNSFIGSIAYPYNEKVQHLLNLRAPGIHDTVGAWKHLVEGARAFLSGSTSRR